MDIKPDRLAGEVFREELRVEDPDILNRAVDTGGEEGAESQLRIVIFTREEGFEDDVEHGVKDFPLGGVEFSFTPDRDIREREQRFHTLYMATGWNTLWNSKK